MSFQSCGVMVLLLIDGDEPQQHVEQQVGEVFGEALQHVGLLRVGVTRLDGGAAQ